MVLTSSGSFRSFITSSACSGVNSFFSIFISTPVGVGGNPDGIVSMNSLSLR
jgi:hypothetical protein